MSAARLLLANLRFHWRGNLAVMLGVAVGTAVLTGALLVGDSLRGSLSELTLQRLWWVDHTLIVPRFFREELGQALHADRVAPAIMLQAAVSNPAGKARVNKVVLLGVDERFWIELPLSKAFWKPESIDVTQRGIVLSQALALDLGLNVGDAVAFHLQKISAAPRETLLGKRKADEVLTEARFKVAAILPDDHPGSRFSLNPTPGTPRNAYVPLAVLQEEIHKQAGKNVLPERPANALLIQGKTRGELQQALRAGMRLEDLGLALRQPRKFGKAPQPGYLSLESQQMFLERWVEPAVKKAELANGPTLVYLVNNLATTRQHLATIAAALSPGDSTTWTRPWMTYYGPLQTAYSIAAALDPSQPPPLGSFLPPGHKPLADDEILLVDWPDSPLRNVGPGETVALTYFQPDEESQLREKTKVFRVATTIGLTGAAHDRNLTPAFPGITDKLTLDQWEAPFPFDKTRRQPRDDKFWIEHRATPRAYVSRQAGENLWGSRFGSLTSIRIVLPKAADPGEDITRRLLAQVTPEMASLQIDDLRRDRLEASAQGTDFGVLFLAFSFFLIGAALLLVGLLFRLNLERRASEIGLLLATGWRLSKVRRLLLLEGLLVAMAGGIVGLLLAQGYAGLLLDYLARRWPGGLDRSFLQRHVAPTSLVVGYVAALIVSLLTIRWALRLLAKTSPRALLQGETSEQSPGESRRRWSPWILGAGLLGALACFVLGFLSSDHMAQAGSFMGSGALLLTAGLAAVALWLKATRQPVAGQGMPALARLGIRNAARHPTRSLLTVGLLAAATFMVVAVQAFHRETGSDFSKKSGGSGGFALIAESEIPIYQDLNQPKGRRELDLPEASEPVLREATFVPLRVRGGDDASCLNLYQPRRPRLIAVPTSLIQRGGFQFAGTLASKHEEIANPWLLLNTLRADEIPVFGEVNTVTYQLKSSLGGIVKVQNERGEEIKLRIVGLLSDSVFQGELVMAEEAFLKQYPRQEGYQLFLIDPGPKEAAAKVALEQGLADHGFAVTYSATKLEGFLQVQNTYLATFQALGGMALLLGTLGLAVVLLRSVWERRAELALFRALGFRRSALAWLVLAENLYLLVLGLGVGGLAAGASVSPHLLGAAGGEMFLRLLALLGLVLLVGLVTGAVAVAATLRAPLVPALRRE